MSILFPSCNRLLFSVKLMFISTAVISVAMILKFSVPAIFNFATSEVPLIWSVMISWLRPPYVYILINCIIISIVASSKIKQKSVDDSRSEIMTSQLQTAEAKVPEDVGIQSVVLDDVVSSGYEYDLVVAKEKDVVMAEPEVVNDLAVDRETVIDTAVKMIDDGDLKKSRDLERTESMEISILNEKEEKKPPVSSRFAHRKTSKSGSEGGKPLGVSKPKKQDTLENTWKTITEGRSMPLTRHLKKSDTWEHNGRRQGNSNQLNDENAVVSKVNKSETFNERTSAVANSTLSRSTGSGKLKKEPSLGQDELNRRVEAFIKKFNEDMRLQRQESLNQYKEMMSRGAH